MNNRTIWSANLVSVKFPKTRTE